MFLKDLIDKFIIVIGGNNNAIIFSSILTFLISFLLMVVTLIYVVLIFRNNKFSEEYSKFKITDDLGKEREHEINESIIVIMKLKKKYESSDIKIKAKAFITEDMAKFTFHFLRIYNYFERVYLNYKYKKLNNKIFFEQLSNFVVYFKEEINDKLMINLVEESVLKNKESFLELYNICKKNLHEKNN
ncbi:MAG: hypothetical protein WC549_05460 [Actinomycetota bacterium]